MSTASKEGRPVATEPEQVDQIFVAAMNAGDIDTIMSLYDDRTVFVQPPGETEIRGLTGLRRHLESFVALDPRLNVELKQFVRAGDTALFSVRWYLSGTDASGRQRHMHGTDANVVRRQPDGSWRTLIDNPFHDQHLGLVEPANLRHRNSSNRRLSR